MMASEEQPPMPINVQLEWIRSLKITTSDTRKGESLNNPVSLKKT